MAESASTTEAGTTSPGTTSPGASGSRAGAGVHRPPLVPIVLVLLVLVLGLTALSISVGAVRIPLAEVLQVLGHRVGLTESAASQQSTSVVLQLRVPRTVMGAIVGASLAVSGAALQSMFTNPLADPGVIGISGGAATGAIAMIVLAGAGTGTWLVPLGAFAAGLAVTALIYLLARPGRVGGTARMLLVGIAVGSGCQAANGFLTYIADDTALASLTFWQLGSLAKVSGPQVLSVLPVFALGLTLILLQARQLDALTLGEREARHLGVNVRRTRAGITIAAALLVGAAVSFAGSIGFVGLVVPHIVRQLVGPLHRALLPLSALTGAGLVMAADCAARTLRPPTEIPIGLFTAAVGAPFFLALILKNRRLAW